MIRGYARVSTADQDLAAQLDALRRAGASEVYAEKISGAKRDRAELTKLLAALAPGDVLLVTRLDRLARSTMDLLNILEVVSQRRAAFKSIADAWCDTTSPHGRLMITILGGLAEFERELIKARTGEGRRRAVERGVKMGRPEVLNADQKAEILGKLQNGFSVKSLSKEYGVNRRAIDKCKPTRAVKAPAVPCIPAVQVQVPTSQTMPLRPMTPSVPPRSAPHPPE